MKKHKLGFTVIPLLRIGPYRVVAHWWPAGESDPDVHSHRWDFWSFLLWGSLRERRYLVTWGTQWQAYRCMPGSLPEDEPYRDVHLSMVSDEVRRAPGWYSGTREVFHEASTEREALTVFVQKRRTEEPFSVVVRPKVHESIVNP